MWSSPSLWWWCAVLWLYAVPSSAPSPRTSIPRHRRSSNTEQTSNSSQEWFKQQLDHVDPTDDSEWEQRYWVNADYHRGGGPVFLYMAGEWEETGFSEDLTEPWERCARLFGALMFKLEHRFYGDSQPTGAVSSNLTVDDLQYLSSAQALADTASFIVAMNRRHQLPRGTKWVAWGCSYAGTLAAWLRYKYPHLVYGSVASSAPLLFNLTFSGYQKGVENALVKFYGKITHNDTLGGICLDNFKKANEEVAELLKTPEGLNLTFEMFQFTESLESDKNEFLKEYNSTVEHVMNWLITLISSEVQANVYRYETKTWGIQRLCDALLNESLGGMVNRYAYIYNTINSENESNENETNTQWSYQLCSELGTFQTVDDNSTLKEFLAQEAFNLKDCLETFGERFTQEFIRRRVDRTNTMYGGLDMEATRVIYTQGTLDPWFSLGLNQTKNPLSPVILIEGGFHCDDTIARSYKDSASLRAARANVTRTLKDWMEPPASNNTIR